MEVKFNFINNPYLLCLNQNVAGRITAFIWSACTSRELREEIPNFI